MLSLLNRRPARTGPICIRIFLYYTSVLSLECAWNTNCVITVILPERESGPVYISVVNQIKNPHLYPTRYREYLSEFYSNLSNLITSIIDNGGKKGWGSFVPNNKRCWYTQRATHDALVSSTERIKHFTTSTQHL